MQNPLTALADDVAAAQRALDLQDGPELQRTMANKIGATTQSLAAGHLPMLSQPACVAAFIMEVAQQLVGYESVRD